MVLREFSKALDAHKEELGYNQLWRYKTGRLPKVLRWIAERPELAAALAEDARALAATEEAMLPQGRGAAREAA